MMVAQHSVVPRRPVFVLRGRHVPLRWLVLGLLISCSRLGGAQVVIRNFYVDRNPPVVLPPDLSTTSPFTSPPGSLTTDAAYVGETSGDDSSQNPGGSFTLAAGSDFVTNQLIIAHAPSTTGLFMIDQATSGTGSSMNIQDTAYVGYQGAGTLVQFDNGGPPVSFENLVLGASGGSGAYELMSGNLSTGNVVIGQAGSSGPSGVFTQAQGNHAVAATMTLGQLDMAHGTYNLQNGNFSIASNLNIGVAGEGIFNQSGGNAVLGDFITGGGTLQLGLGAGHNAAGLPSQNVYDQTAGMLTIYGDAQIGCAACDSATGATSSWSLMGEGAVVTGTTTFGVNGSLAIGNGATFTTGALVNGSGTTPTLSVVDPYPSASGLLIGNNSDSILNGAINDGASAGGLSKLGTGSVSLAGQNAYTGATIVRDGVLHLAPGAAVPGNVELGITAAQFHVADAQYLVHPSTVLLQASEMTLAGWVYFDSKTSNEVIAAKDDNLTVPGSEYWLGYELSSDRFIFQVIGAVHYRTQSDNYGGPPLHTWIYVVGWYDSSTGRVYVSINNGPANSAPVTLPLNATKTPFSIGADVAEAGTSGSYTDGRIASVGLWKRVLTPAERTFLYNNGTPLPHAALPGPLRGKLLSWWDLAEKSGDRVDAEGVNPATDHNGVGSALGATHAISLTNEGTIGGSVTIGGGGTLSGGGTINGDLTVDTQGLVVFNHTAGTIKGNITNNGLFVVSGGAQFNEAGASFVNNGTLDISTAGGFTAPSGVFNSGVIIDSSVIRPQNVVFDGSGVTVAIDSYTGHSYQLQTASSPAGPFSDLGNPQAGSTGKTLDFVDPNPGPNLQFYRIAVD